MEKNSNGNIPYVLVGFGGLLGSIVFLIWLRKSVLVWSARISAWYRGGNKLIAKRSFCWDF